MATVYLSLGSNIGDKQGYLREAVALLGENPEIKVEKVSKFYETSPVGGVVQDDFVNLALKISTSLEALALLERINAIEAKLNRVRKIHWGPRTIDIDILFYGDEKINNERLTVPHKEVFNRLFVLIPLLELVDNDFKYFAEMKQAIERLSQAEQKIQELAE